MLDMLDSLDLFQDVFDIDEYRRNRLDSFVHLIGKKTTVMLSGVYKHFLKTEPLLIKRAEGIAGEASRGKAATSAKKYRTYAESQKV